MLLLEGIGTIVFGLWVMSQGTGPGDSIMIVLGLPVVLFGVVLTIIGFAKSMKEKTPDVSELGSERSSKDRDLFPNIEDPLPYAESVEPQSLVREQNVQGQQSKRNICPECGAKYGLIDLIAQPAMCSKCWKKSKSGSIR